MIEGHKATRIQLLDFRTPPMRAFHMSWFAFFVCFFAWFGIAPLMQVVRQEMGLTRDQVGWCIIGSVTFTALARVMIGWICDRIGPRLAYTWLLLLGSIPVMCIGLADSYETFLLARVAIGGIGASFVITQYHTSAMFAPNCVGTANATTAGWGNLGGGATQLAMPLALALFVGGLGFSEALAWRASMTVAGVLCAATGIAYFLLTQDTPEGNLSILRSQGRLPERSASGGSFLSACRDHRVWALFVVYGACFGVELTILNVAALYFLDYFSWFQQMETIDAMKTAGTVAALYGLTNVFARTLGGVFGDRCGQRWGLKGRVRWLFVALFCEGLALMLFAQLSVLSLAVPALMVFAVFVQMSNGATFSVVPFINPKALGSVAGIVGAGGNAGAVAAGFLFKTDAITWPTALLILGALVTCCSFLVFIVNFSEAAESEARAAIESAVAKHRRSAKLAGAASLT